jgi:beta-lactamase superfamily II metal-dependent hydrolase
MITKYVGAFSTPLRNDAGRRLATLIWGDPVHVLQEAAGAVKVRARAWEGYVDPAVLSDRSLLEIYIIDVGQGDGVLLKTPEGKWHLIDGGVASRDQMTKKGVANFVRWKFIKDLLQDKVRLANVIVTHPDYDHYGGLLDVLGGKLYDGRTFGIEVENFYHSGLGRFKQSPKLGQSAPGEVAPFPQGSHGVGRKGKFITELLDGQDSFAHPPRELQEPFTELAALVGRVPQTVRRLSAQDRFLPGYAPGENAVTIRVLSPLLEQFANGAGLRVFDSDSKTVNGHSVVLRLDYGQARILLSGDLNATAQKLLRSYHPDNEFAVDVAKACHHGSEDVDYDFLKAMQPRATVVSSGDNEDYSHPRPVLLGASAHYGREATAANGELLAPLLYSTELARSIKLDYAAAVLVDLDQDPRTPGTLVYPNYVMVKAGEGQDAKYRPLRYTPVMVDLVYGLVNVRTDGVNILCATMVEKSNDFDVKVFRAG